MNVLFVSSVSGLEGGAERSLLELARALRSRGHEVMLAAWRSGELTAAFGDFGQTFTLGADADPTSPLGGVTERVPFIRPLVDLLNRIRLQVRPTGPESDWLYSVFGATGADVVHSNCDLSPPATAAAAGAMRVPWVAHVRDHWRSWFHPRIAGTLRVADAVIAPSEFLADRFRQHHIDPAVIPNPVAGDELRRVLTSEERTRLRVELLDEEAPPPDVDAAFLVAVVGRLDEQKGALRVVQAARRLREHGDDRVRFLLAGRGTEPFEARLRDAIHAAGLGDRIRLLGYRTDVPRWLPAVDALAVSSTGEPFGRMIVEGMHAGLPVVAFRSGAAPELIDDGRTGILLPEGDTDALADALRSLTADPDRARRFGAGARSAAERYEPDTVAAEIERLYLRLMES